MIHCLFLLTDPVVSAVFSNAWSFVKVCCRTDMGQTSVTQHNRKIESKKLCTFVHKHACQPDPLLYDFYELNHYPKKAILKDSPPTTPLSLTIIGAKANQTANKTVQNYMNPPHRKIINSSREIVLGRHRHTSQLLHYLLSLLHLCMQWSQKVISFLNVTALNDNFNIDV